jgi:L-ribulose-5-phosphate 3-epimerase
MDRRQVLKTLAAAAATRLAAQTPARPAAQNQRRAPQILVFSQNLIQIEYPELGDIVKQMGFDGVDLTVRPGGHVEPRLANVDLVRAFEVMSGEGLDIPVITTAITTPMDRTAVPVIALAGMSGAKVFRTGTWPAGNNPNPQFRLAEVQRDFAGLMNIGRQYTISPLFHNEVGDNVGSAVADTQRILEPLDPTWSGYYFDVPNAAAQDAGNYEAALRLMLPRLKAVTIQDFTWDKKQLTKVRLGDGAVDWSKFFQTLAQASYTGPVTLEIGYTAKDMPSALVRDLEFTRKQMLSAYGLGPKT